MENSIFQEKRISKAYIVLSLPLVMSMVVSLVYNLADTYFVAQTNNTDLVAGVSLGAPIFTLLMPYGNESIAAMGIALKVSMIALLVITGFCFGGSPLFGYYYGAGNRERLQACFHFCFRFLIVVALILTVFVYIAAPALIRGMMDQESILLHGTLMLRWQVLTMVFVAINMLVTIICQSTGKILPSFILSISRQGIVFVVVLLIASNLFGYHGVIRSQAIADIITAAMSMVIFVKVFGSYLKKEA